MSQIFYFTLKVVKNKDQIFLTTHVTPNMMAFGIMFWFDDVNKFVSDLRVDIVLY